MTDYSLQHTNSHGGFNSLIEVSEELGTFFRTLKHPYKGTEVKHQICSCLWDGCSQWI